MNQILQPYKHQSLIPSTLQQGLTPNLGNPFSGGNSNRYTHTQLPAIDPLKKHAYGLNQTINKNYQENDAMNKQKMNSIFPMDYRSKSIDEWQALQQIQQLKVKQQEKEQEIRHQEKRARLAESLDNQIKTKQDVKSLEYFRGVGERQLLDQLKNIGDEQEHIEQELTNNLKNSISKDNYAQNQQHHFTQLRQRLSDLQQEQKWLKSIQISLNQEKIMKQQEQEKFQASVKELQMAKNYEKVKEKDKVQQEREDYRKKCLLDTQLQKKQQQQYLEYFKMQDQSQTERQKQYNDKVLIPQLKQLDQISLKELKDQTRYQNLLLEKEIQQKNNKINMQDQTHNINRDLLDNKSKQRFISQLSKQKDIKDRLMTERNLHIESALSYEKNRNQQNFYKLTLDQQNKFRDFNQYGQMTLEEKKLNKLDLDQFNNWDTSLNHNNGSQTHRLNQNENDSVNISGGLVPGLIHNKTIGSVPVKTQKLYENAINGMTSLSNIHQPFFTARNSNRTSLERLPSRQQIQNNIQQVSGYLVQTSSRNQSKRQSRERLSLNQNIENKLNLNEYQQHIVSSPPLKQSSLRTSIDNNSTLKHNNLEYLNSDKMKNLISYKEPNTNQYGYNTIINPIVNKEKNPIIQRMKLQQYQKSGQISI
eukprot:403348296